LFGRRSAWTGSDLVKALVEMPATSLRLARRLCGLFFGEAGLGDSAVRALAAGLREHQLNVAWAIATILRSTSFFDDDNIGTRVLSPIEFTVGATIALGRTDTPPSTLVLADWMARLGQDLFYPPNVSGWPGGRSWVSSRSLIGRANFSSALVDGLPVGIPTPIDAGAIAQRQGKPCDRAGVIAAAATLLFGTEPAPAFRDGIDRACGSGPQNGTHRRAIALVLASPEAQLG